MRILIAEDDAVSRCLLQTMLENWGYEIVVTNDGREAWDALRREDAPRLAILDWMMPQIDGIEVCKRVRRQASRDYTYVMLLTARGRKKDLIDGMEAGADDYITKPFDSGEMKVRLRAAERILDLQNRLLNAQEALRKQATHDFLTGLYNRQAINEILHLEAQRADRNSTPTSVIMGDLDHFKRINDTYGHGAGDEVLREVGARLGVHVRQYDSVSRYGGEEFLIVLPDCDMDAAQRLAQRLCDSIAGEPYNVRSNRKVYVTMSLGIATRRAGEAIDPDKLIRLADAAMYAAKAAGRNRVSISSEAASQPAD